MSNFELSLSFYTEFLLFEIEYQRPEDRFAFLNFQGSQLMIEQENGYWDTGPLEYPYGRGLNLSIQIDDLEDVIASLRRHDYPIKLGPELNRYRMDDKILCNRELLVLDPDGYLLRFTQPLDTESTE